MTSSSKPIIDKASTTPPIPTPSFNNCKVKLEPQVIDMYKKAIKACMSIE